MKASDLLKEGAALVDGDRRETHGDPREQMACTAALWSAYKGVPFSPEEVAMFNLLQKVSRTRHGAFNKDDYVDGAGYVALAGEVRDAD